MIDSDLSPTPNHGGGVPHLNFEEGTSMTKLSGRTVFSRDPTKNSHVFIDPRDR
jgi:hypothetical protein